MPAANNELSNDRIALALAAMHQIMNPKSPVEYEDAEFEIIEPLRISGPMNEPLDIYTSQIY